MGGGGGAPILGMGGGGGAPPEGIGGGGGAPLLGIGGGGGAAGGEANPEDAGPGDDAAGEPVSIGLGGAMVPKRIDASCLALPPVGLSSSSSSDDESTTDQSSSSLGFTVRRAETAAGSGNAVFVASETDSRWNGFVSTAAGEVMFDAGTDAGFAMLLKNGFFDSSGGLVTVGCGGAAGGAGGAGADMGGGDDNFLGSSWLAAGVLSCGVMLAGPSSSEESSSSMFSSCS